MKKTYEAPVLAHRGDAVRNTEVISTPPNKETLHAFDAPGSVGFAL